jgi:hypothetical protein
MKITQTLSILILSITGLSFADSTATKDSTSEKTSFGGLPAIAYSEETGLQLGALIKYYLPHGSEATPASIGFAYLGSFKNQHKLSLFPKIYSPSGNWFYKGANDILFWPTQHFGLAEEAQEDSAQFYERKAITHESILDRKIHPKLWIGGKFVFQYDDNKWDSDSLALDHPWRKQRAFEGGLATGLGGRLIFDARDRANAPLDGMRGLAEYLVLASDRPEIDLGALFLFSLSHYLPIGNGTLGSSIKWESITGEIPVFMLPTLDGTYQARGANINGTAQLELRQKLFWRIWAAGFTELSSVSNTLDTFGNQLIPIFGGGLRYELNPEQHDHVRVDLSYVEGSMGLVVYVNEAF